MSKKELQDKVREIQLRVLRQREATLKRGNDYVPTKKKSKPLGYKMQNTFERNLRGVPGGSMSRGVGVAIMKMAQAPTTGTKTGKEIGILRSARNANTTQGSHNRSVVTDESGHVVCDAQGRRVFGR